MLLAESFLERNGTLFQILATALGAAVAGIGGWWLRSRNKKSKTFDYRVVSDVPILSHRPDDNELKVTYLAEEIDNPRLVRVRLVNTGTEVIRASEILEQYVLTVDDAWMVSAQMTEKSATNLASFEATCDEGQHGVRMTLATLNSGDHFTLQMIVDSADEVNITLSGRIEGQTRPPQVYVEREPTSTVSRVLTVAAGIAAVISFVGVILVQRQAHTKDEYLSFIAPMWAVFGLFFGLNASVAQQYFVRWRRRHSN